jgi:hypothetical protein
MDDTEPEAMTEEQYKASLLSRLQAMKSIDAAVRELLGVIKRKGAAAPGSLTAALAEWEETMRVIAKRLTTAVGLAWVLKPEERDQLMAILAPGAFPTP